MGAAGLLSETTAPNLTGFAANNAAYPRIGLCQANGRTRELQRFTQTLSVERGIHLGEK